MKVVRETAIQLFQNGGLVEVPAGQPYDLPDDEAKALVEAGVVQSAEKPSKPPVAPPPAPPIGENQ